MTSPVWSDDALAWRQNKDQTANLNVTSMLHWDGLPDSQLSKKQCDKQNKKGLRKRGRICFDLLILIRLYNFRDHSLITTWGGRQIVRANAANFSIPPYANHAKISVPPTWIRGKFGSPPQLITVQPGEHWRTDTQTHRCPPPQLVTSDSK